MKKSLILTAFCATFAAPLAAQDTGMNTVVAIIDGETITMTHVLDIRRQLPEQYQSIPPAQLLPGIVDQLIQQRVLANAAPEPHWIDEAISNQRASLLAGEAVVALAESAVSPEAVQAFYDEQFGNFTGEPQFNASHILVETEDEAASLVEKANAGADFSELAKEFSTGPSGPSGGELGWFGRGMMVPAFEAAVRALEVGQISAPVETQFGWHVVRLNDTRTESAPAIEDVREDIVGQLRSIALDARVTELRAAADIEITLEGVDPELLNTLSLFGE